MTTQQHEALISDGPAADVLFTAGQYGTVLNWKTPILLTIAEHTIKFDRVWDVSWLHDSRQFLKFWARSLDEMIDAEVTIYNSYSREGDMRYSLIDLSQVPVVS